MLMLMSKMFDLCCFVFYRGEQSDLWSCGVVLVTMLAGELPWESPERYNFLSLRLPGFFEEIFRRICCM